MAEIEKSKKKGKGAKRKEADVDASSEASDSNASVSNLISAGLADLQSSGLLGDGANSSEESAEEAFEYAEAMADAELGTSDESEQMLAAAEEIEDTTAEEVLSEEEAALADEELGPAEFIEADQVSSIIESLLFASQRPVSVSTIKQIFKGSNIRTKDITRCLDEIASDYASSRRGVTLEEVNGGYQLRTKVDNAEFLRRLSKSRPFRLSGPALETLSIIAYKQPITKHEMDEIRGVESGHLVRALMERGLVNFAGKSELPGKPMLYQTTRKFLEIFGLRNLKELPTLSEIDELLPEGIGDEDEAKPKLADITGDLTQQTAGNSYSEGEEELDKINQTLGGIDTSSDFFEQEKVRQRDKRDADRAANIREALAVGEAVEIKDQRWLTRYEAKLAAPQMTEAEAEEMDAAATGAEFTEDIENLSVDLQSDNRVATSDEDVEAGGEAKDDGEYEDDVLEFSVGDSEEDFDGSGIDSSLGSDLDGGDGEAQV